MEAADKIERWAMEQIGSPYVYGATGAPCTPALRREKIRQYPGQAASITRYCQVLSGRAHSCLGCSGIGKRAFDCAQLTRRACEQGGIRLPSGASSQWRYPGYEQKGPLDGGIRGRLCLVFRAGKDRDRPMAHVGLHLRDGRVIDARSAAQGVVIYPLSAYPWTHYAALRLQDEGAAKQQQTGSARAKAERRESENGVLQIQKKLIALGFPLPRYGADGKLGAETLGAIEKALTKMQEVRGCGR